MATELRLGRMEGSVDGPGRGHAAKQLSNTLNADVNTLNWTLKTD